MEQIEHAPTANAAKLVTLGELLGEPVNHPWQLQANGSLNWLFDTDRFSQRLVCREVQLTGPANSHYEPLLRDLGRNVAGVAFRTDGGVQRRPIRVRGRVR